jgi:hypothetical protein
MNVISYSELNRLYHDKACEVVSIKDITAFFNTVARDLLGDVPAHQRQRFVIECYEGMLASSDPVMFDTIGGVQEAFDAYVERNAALQSFAA